ncbi:uncharacterized protein LOC124930324 [Impatiens glandulifera]|uniref:uncharacterized protein LOC124930324 n=1 Tax=Impatiens glandulifera TaxID=253017 RepID=UPI001FB084FD|nr:uncharacterized protein LOC124930324 [Impatiens glandulifera]
MLLHIRDSLYPLKLEKLRTDSMKRFTEQILELISLVIDQAFGSSPSFFTMTMSEFHEMLKSELESSTKQRAESSNQLKDDHVDNENESKADLKHFNLSQLASHVSLSQANDEQSSKEEEATFSKGKQIEDPLVDEQTHAINQISKTKHDESMVILSLERACDKPKVNLKRKSPPTDESEGPSDRSVDDITRKLLLLKELEPNCEEADTYLKGLECIKKLEDEAQINKVLEANSSMRKMMMQSLSPSHTQNLSPSSFGIGSLIGMMNMTSESLFPFVGLSMVNRYGLSNSSLVYSSLLGPSSTEPLLMNYSFEGPSSTEPPLVHSSLARPSSTEPPLVHSSLAGSSSTEAHATVSNPLKPASNSDVLSNSTSSNIINSRSEMFNQVC